MAIVGKLLFPAADEALLLLVEVVVLLVDCFEGPLATVRMTFLISFAVSLLLDPLGNDKSGKLSSQGNMIVVDVTSSERSLFC